MRDHRVAGAPVLPGVVSLELALAAGERALGRPVHRLRNVTFLRPVRAAPDGQLVTRIEVGAGPPPLAFRLFTPGSGGNGSFEENVSAQIEEGPPPAANFDLAAARSSCREPVSVEELYRFFAGLGLDYGPAFRVLHSVRRGTGEALAELVLPSGPAAALRGFCLHPSLLDGSLQSLGAIAFGAAGDAPPLYLPYAIEAVHVYGPVAEPVLAHVRVASPEGRSRGVLRGHITIADRTGRVLVNLVGLAIKEVPASLAQARVRTRAPAAVSAPAAVPNRAVAPSPQVAAGSGLLYEVAWERSDRAAGGALVEGPHWIFEGEDGLGAALARRLRALGRPVVEIQAGAAFTREGPALFTIDPANAADYRKLIDALADAPPAAAVVAFSTGPEVEPTAGRLEADLGRDLVSLLHLSQALLALPRRSVQLRVVSAGSQVPVAGLEGASGPSPSRAAAWGFLRALAFEAPSLHPRAIDVDPSGDPESLAALVMPELGADGTDAEVAYRDGTRFVPRLAALPADDGRPLPIRERAVCLITGGLGGLGLEVARWLATRLRARLILVGRTPLPDRRDWARLASAGDATAARIRAVEALEAIGAEVAVEAADVTDAAALRAAVERARSRFGRIELVVHAAGLVRDGLLRAKSLDSFQAVLRPKVSGAWALDAATAPDHPDLTILFSSVVSITGNIGQTDYAAANRYLDGWAAHRTARGRATLSLNWGPWSEVGMAAGLADMIRSRGVEPLAPAEAIAALEQALRLGRTQIAIAHLPAAIKATVRAPVAAATRAPSPAPGPAPISAPPPAPAAQPAPPPAAAAAAPRKWGPAEIEEVLLRELSRFLQVDIEHLDPEAAFVEYGMDSILAAKLHRRLEERLGTTLPSTMLFELPNVRELARAMVQKLDPATIDRMLSMEDAAPAGSPTAAPAEATAQPLPEQPAVLPAVAAPPPASEVEAAPPTAIAAPTPVAGRRAAASSNSKIAVIGYACRLPGAPDPESCWRVLRAGQPVLCEVPPERFSIADIYDQRPDTPGRTVSKWGGFLDGIELFDPLWFGMSPREAELTDPQQRLLLELTSEALERTGYGGDRLSGTNTGVYIAGASGEYLMRLAHQRERIGAHFVSGNSNSVLANRLSFRFNLRGPSLTLDTACSSSLVALHLAVESLRAGETDLALVGGVNIILEPTFHIAFSQARLLSPTGPGRPFDAAADGYLRAEAAGVALLKPLDAALADGDHIHGVILGTAVNQNGPRNGLAAPSVAALADLMRRACDRAGVDPSSISCVEAHANGTLFSDFAEVEALREVYGSGPRVVLGSAKGTFGHSELASGMTSLIKTLLALEHREHPPVAGFTTPHPKLRLEETPFDVPREPRPWPAGAGTRRAAIDGLGLGGTNAHIIVEEAPPREAAPDDADRPLHLLALSARSEDALRDLAERFAAHLAAHPSLPAADVCFTANTGRARFPQRLAVVGGSAAQLAGALAAGAAKPSPTAGGPAVAPGKRKPRIGVLFTGQGSQYPGMGRALYRAEPVFRRVLDQCDAIARGRLEWPLLQVILGEAPDKALVDQTAYTQPALFSIECALAEVWRSWGVRFHAVLGHSIGELAAACVGGALSLEDGLRLAIERGRLLQSLPRNGAMAAVLAEGSRVQRAVDQVADRVSVAAFNGPEHTVISGERAAVDELIRRFEAEKVPSRRLNVSHAFHSPLVEPVLAPFGELTRQLTFRAPSLTFVSNVTGAALGEGVVADAGYWVRHVRAPVRFADGVAALAAAGCDLFLEVGPDATLAAMGRRALPQVPQTQWLASLRRGQGEWDTLLGTAARLAEAGVPFDWEAFDAGRHRRRVVLPTSRFERIRCWIERSAGAAPAPAAQPQPALAPPAPSIAVAAVSGANGQAPGTSGPAAPRGEATELMRREVAALLGLPLDQLPADQPLVELGLDSVMAIELAAKLEGRLGVELPFDELAAETSLAELIDWLERSHPGALAAIVAPAAGTAAPVPPPVRQPTAPGTRGNGKQHGDAMSYAAALQPVASNGHRRGGNGADGSAPAAAAHLDGLSLEPPAAVAPPLQLPASALVAGGAPQLAPDFEQLPIDRDAYRRHARPAVGEQLSAINLDKIYLAARGDRMSYEEHGRRIEVIDFVGGYGATLFGHNHPELVAWARELLARAVPVQAQASSRAFAGMLAAALSERLRRAVGRSFICTFTSTGAEAIEAALKHADMEYFARARTAERERAHAHALLAQERRQLGRLAPALAAALADVLGSDAVPGDLLGAHVALAALDRPAFERAPVLLALGRSFHGKTAGAVCLTANPDYRTPYNAPLEARVLQVAPGDIAGLNRAIESQLATTWSIAADERGELHLERGTRCTVAGLFLEPVQGEGGVHPLDAGFLAEARALADRHGFPIIIDEIQSGMGRCGDLAAAHRLGLRGDYYTFGKSLGGGLTKTGVLAVDEARYQRDFGVFHTSTFAEDEPGALIALRALEIYDRDDLADRADAKGRRLLARLRELQQRHPTAISDVRGLGLLIGVELADPSRSPSAVIALAGDSIGSLAAGYLLNEERLRVVPTASAPRTLRLEPSAYIKDADLDRCVAGLDRLCRILEAGNAGRLLRHLVTDGPLDPDGPIADHRARHPRRAPDDGAAPGEPRAAFLTYQVEAEDLLRLDPSMEELPEGSCERLLRRLHAVTGPQVLRRVRVRAAGGRTVHLTVIGLMVTSTMIEEMMRAGDTSFLRAQIDDAVELACAEGCGAVGFGGLLSVVTHNCKKSLRPGVALTTGNALTVGMGVEAIRSGCSKRGIDLAAATVALIGATGNICSTYARLIAEECARLILIGRKRSLPRLLELAEALYDEALVRLRRDPRAHASGLGRAILASAAGRAIAAAAPAPGDGARLRAALDEELADRAPIRAAEEYGVLASCQVIVSATNSAAPIIYPEHLGPHPAVICDIAVPSDVAPSVAAARPDVLVIAGGDVRLPAEPELDLCAGHLPAGHVYACMAETLLLGLDGHRANYSIGAIEKEQVTGIMAIAAEQGFTLGEAGPAGAAR